MDKHTQQLSGQGEGERRLWQLVPHGQPSVILRRKPVDLTEWSTEQRGSSVVDPGLKAVTQIWTLQDRTVVESSCNSSISSLLPLPCSERGATNPNHISPLLLHLVFKRFLFILFLYLHLHLSNHFLHILSPDKSGKVVAVGEVTWLERIRSWWLMLWIVLISHWETRSCRFKRSFCYLEAFSHDWSKNKKFKRKWWWDEQKQCIDFMTCSIPACWRHVMFFGPEKISEGGSETIKDLPTER